ELPLDYVWSIAIADRDKKIIRVEKDCGASPFRLFEAIDPGEVEQMTWRPVANGLPHQANNSLDARSERQHLEVSGITISLKSHCAIVLDFRSTKKTCL